MKTHKDKEFTCDICAKGISTLRALRRHLFTIHQVEFEGKEKDSIMKDVNRKPLFKSRPVEPECEKCQGKSFKNIDDFNNHVLACYGPKLLNKYDVEYKCNQCSTKWNSAEVLRYHLFLEHQVNEQVCDICGTIFKTHKSFLEKHKNQVHFQRKDYQCKECSKVYACSTGLKKHVDEIHRGIKRFECKECGYKTNARNRMTNHTKTVHTKEPFHCNYCDFICYSHKAHQKHTFKVHAPMKSKRKIILTQE